MARGHVGAPLERQLRRRAVALRRAPTPGGFRASARRAAHLERHAEPLAQLPAVALVASAAVAQAVVDVQRADRVAPGDADRESSRQVESRPPESSTSTGRPGASRPSDADRVEHARRAPRPRCRAQEHLRGLAEALQPDLADALELEVRTAALDHRPGDEHLAPARRGPARAPRC